MSQANPWAVTEIDRDLVDRLARQVRPCDQAVERGVDLVGDPHQEDDDGRVWTRLSAARQVSDVVPGSVVLLGSAIGRYLATVVAWDFEVDPDDPIVVLDLLPIRPSAVERLLERNRAAAV
jgi:hypothetical protein